MGSSRPSITARSTSEKSTAATCRAEAAVTPPPAAVAAARAGSRSLVSVATSPTVSRPRPMRASMSPADTAVTHRAPTAVTHRPPRPP